MKSESDWSLDNILTFSLCGLTIVTPLIIYIGVRWYYACRECCENDAENQSDSDTKSATGCVACLRVFSAVFNFAWWFWIIGLIVFHAVPINDLPQLYVAEVVASVALAVFFLYESVKSRERSYVHNLHSVKTISDILGALQKTPPEITMIANCYHYETTTRLITEYDSFGVPRTRTETDQKRVDTATIRENFVFQSWKDVSEPSIREEFSKHAALRIKMTLDIHFGDSNTRAAFNSQYAAFQKRCKRKDTHQDFYEWNPAVEGFEEHLAAYVDRSQIPWWMKERYFWLSTLLCIPWVYRLLFNRYSSQTSYTLAKYVYATG